MRFSNRRTLSIVALLSLVAARAGAEALEAIGDEHCVAASSEKRDWVNLRGPRTVRWMLGVIAASTCEWFVLPAALADTYIEIRLPVHGELPISLAEARDRVLARVRLLGVEVKPQKVTRLSGGPPPPRPSPAAISDEELDRGVRCDGTRCTLSRALADKLLGNPTRLAMGARIVPAIKNDKPDGFKVYAIRPSSVYARLGLQNGDTVRTLNGFDITTPDRALEAYSKLRAAEKIVIELERRGAPVTLEWTIVAP